MAAGGREPPLCNRLVRNAVKRTLETGAPLRARCEGESAESYTSECSFYALAEILSQEGVAADAGEIAGDGWPMGLLERHAFLVASGYVGYLRAQGGYAVSMRASTALPVRTSSGESKGD
jgi:hypothetical protein